MSAAVQPEQDRDDEWAMPPWVPVLLILIGVTVTGGVLGFFGAFVLLAPEDPLGPWPPVHLFAALGASTGLGIGAAAAGHRWRRSGGAPRPERPGTDPPVTTGTR